MHAKQDRRPLATRGPDMPATPTTGDPPPPTGVTRILVADDHPVTREGLALILDNQPDMEVVAQAADGREAVGMYAAVRPDVAMLDLQMPGLSGAAATEKIVRADPAARVLLLTTYDGDEDIYRGMHAGAKAYLLKEASRAEILHAVRAVARGQRYLSPAAGAKLADRLGAPRADRPGTGGGSARGGGAGEQGDRGRAVGLRGDGQEPPEQHHVQARGHEPHGGRADRDSEGHPAGLTSGGARLGRPRRRQAVSRT
jgi:DNA-binding NarL/FixJ family response regulator